MRCIGKALLGLFIVIGFGILGILVGAFTGLFASMLLQLILIPFYMVNSLDLAPNCVFIGELIGVCVGIIYGIYYLWFSRT